MIRFRPAETRGHFQFGWLDTWHTFSFGEYFDPAHHQFRALRVINEDRVQPNQGFGTHGHTRTPWATARPWSPDRPRP
jgi:hypothetical protein